jgi:hypothetical protein
VREKSTLRLEFRRVGNALNFSEQRIFLFLTDPDAHVRTYFPYLVKEEF